MAHKVDSVCFCKACGDELPKGARRITKEEAQAYYKAWEGVDMRSFTDFEIDF